MNADLTINSLTYKLAFSDKNGSERREVARGVNLPTVMTVRHEVAKNKTTGVAENRSVLRFDRMTAGAEGKILPVSAYLVVVVPQDPTIVSSDVTAVIENIIGTIQEDDTGLDLADEIFVNREQ
jgi:hypothetical protein